MVKFLHTNLGLILFTFATFSFQARAENNLLDPSPTTLIELENVIRKVLNDSKTPAAGIAMVKGTVRFGWQVLAWQIKKEE